MAQTLQDALFPLVALEVHKPIEDGHGGIFAGVGDVVLARGNERGRFASILLTHGRTGAKIECTWLDLSDVSVLDGIPA